MNRSNTKTNQPLPSPPFTIFPPFSRYPAEPEHQTPVTNNTTTPPICSKLRRAKIHFQIYSKIAPSYQQAPLMATGSEDDAADCATKEDEISASAGCCRRSSNIILFLFSLLF